MKAVQRRPLILSTIALLSLTSCGGGGGPAGPSAAPGPRTTTFMGVTQLSVDGCSSNGRHEFAAGEGNVVVTLVQAAASTMAVQVCHASAVDHTLCTIPPFARIGVGESLSAPLRGGRTTQIVTVYPEGCGQSGALPTPPLTYTVTVTYPG